MISLEPQGFAEVRLTLTCPTCAHGFAHVIAAGRAKEHSGSYGDWEILIEGEGCGHLYRVVVSDHKGQCFLKVEAVSDAERGMVSLDSPVGALGLSTRAAHVAERAGIDTIWQLTEKTQNELLRLKHCGKRTVSEFRERLKMHGYALAEHSAPYVPVVEPAKIGRSL